MKTLSLRLALALVLALGTVPRAVCAQDLSYRSGPQFAIDHFKSTNIAGLGTNVGVGYRWYNAVTANLHGYASAMLFEDLGNGGGGFFANAYAEGIVSLMISPRGVRDGASPYFGGGGALLAAAGVGNAGSPLILAGVNFIGRSRIPFVELQYFTHGGRMSAVVGLFF